MVLTDGRFPSSEAFQAIQDALDISDVAKQNAIRQGNGIFGFVLKNTAAETMDWQIDLKDRGAVTKGMVDKPDVTLSLSDQDFGLLTSGKVNAQRLFMSGKLKIKGNMMQAMKLDPILKQAQQTKAKL